MPRWRIRQDLLTAPNIRSIPWRRKWQPTPVFWPGEFHGQRSLAGYSPWGCKELDMTECTCARTHTHTHTHTQHQITSPGFSKGQGQDWLTCDASARPPSPSHCTFSSPCSALLGAPACPQHQNRTKSGEPGPQEWPNCHWFWLQGLFHDSLLLSEM